MIDQIGIALTGVMAIFLTQSKSESRRRYACLFGMAGQPAWFWAAISAEQWGVTFVCVLYTAAWAKGVWQHWIRPRVREVPGMCPLGATTHNLMSKRPAGCPGCSGRSSS